MTHDPVHLPAHYVAGRQFEVIDILEDQVQLAPDPINGALQWQVLKYLCRLWGKGNAVEDARKARWYLDRLIQRLESGA